MEWIWVENSSGVVGAVVRWTVLEDEDVVDAAARADGAPLVDERGRLCAHSLDGARDERLCQRVHVLVPSHSTDQPADLCQYKEQNV